MKPLLTLARNTLEAHFQNKKPEIPEQIKQKYSKKQACFVTLTKNGQLRGCIGSLQATQELYLDVIENTTNAAFHDPRFSPLTKQELPNIKIEISLLSVPKKLPFQNEQDLLKKINNRMGLILKKGSFRSTFLPQVWQELPNKVEFLKHLSMKAGLPPDAWKTAEFSYYAVKKIKE